MDLGMTGVEVAVVDSSWEGLAEYFGAFNVDETCFCDDVGVSFKNWTPSVHAPPNT